MGLLEIALSLCLGIWALLCTCYVFDVPRISVALNRINWFELFAPWALATTKDLRSSSGAHTLEFCDIASPASEGPWTEVVASDHWRWHAFLWFPQRLRSMPVQSIGRQLGLLIEMTPLPVKTIAAHGATLEKLVRRLHPPVSGSHRRVRLRRRLVREGEEVTFVLWQSAASGHDVAP